MAVLYYKVYCLRFTDMINSTSEYQHSNIYCIEVTIKINFLMGFLIMTLVFCSIKKILAWLKGMVFRLNKFWYCRKTPILVMKYCQKILILSENSDIIDVILFGKLRYHQKNPILLMYVNYHHKCRKTILHPTTSDIYSMSGFAVGISISV